MKPKVGFFSFTSCEGCQLQVLNLEEQLLDIAGAVDLVTFREAMDPIDRDYDIAFVEGSISRESEKVVLEEIRSKADVVVALGACAASGCVNAIKNHFTSEENLREVYGESARYYDTIDARPIDAVVAVDYYLRTCPITREEFLRLFTSLLLARQPYDPNFAVCVECRLAENICVYDTDEGEFCMGPVTRAGCGALCPGFGSACIGCRGFIEQANFESMLQVMEDYGMPREDAVNRLKMFNAALPEAEGVK